VYDDYEGNEVTEDYYFHLSQAELVEIELSQKGGLAQMLEKIIADEDGAMIIREFKKIILAAYGVRSDDGKRFMKSQQLREEFEATEAYSTLFIELVTDAEAAADFVNGIVPTKLAEQAQSVVKDRAALSAAPDPVDDIPPTPPSDPEVISRLDLVNMEKSEFEAVQGRISKGEVVLGE